MRAPGVMSMTRLAQSSMKAVFPMLNGGEALIGGPS